MQNGVDLLVFEEGEGVILIHHQGHDQGADFLFEIGVQIAALLIGGGGVGDLHHSVSPQGLHDFHIGIVPLGLKLPDPLEDGLQLLLGGHAAAGVLLVRVFRVLVVQGPYPDPEEFIQVGLENGGEFQPLQQGRLRAARLLQHPLVKFQPGKLPVVKAFKSHSDSFLRQCRKHFLSFIIAVSGGFVNRFYRDFTEFQINLS